MLLLHRWRNKGMVQLTETPDLKVLFDTIHQSHFIKNHADFYAWLQQRVAQFIPHDVLVASWGDFKQGNLNSDISSNIHAVHTQQVVHGCSEIEPLMQDLHRKWKNHNEKWFFFEEFNASELSMGYSKSDMIMGELQNMKSVLVYGYHDKRGEHDILYAFFRASDLIETQTAVLSMIMPHLDAALRSIECLPNPAKKIINSGVSGIISERECEVMNLVLQGHTNSEIAETMFISPNTVKNHLKTIFKKMEVSSRAEAVARYMIDVEFETGDLTGSA